MRKLIKLIPIIGAAILTTSCSTKYLNVHVPLTELSFICTFDHYTLEDESIMPDSVGRKIYSNKEKCQAQREKNRTLITKHNDLHKE